ncbi:hypothetical protein BJY52DRAFT_1226233 [Lactarius psammicola]|nr:hypothetical protein BJY52DRAFT_1226233 [Lactarius psammicola]
MSHCNGNWTATGIAWKNFSHPSSSREEYGNHEQPGFRPSYMSYAPIMPEDSNFRPRGILTADLQYPFHHEPPSTVPPYQGNHPVGHPSLTPHHVSERINFCPMVSDTPTGAFISPPSFCTPPLHSPGWSPAPFSYPPYDPRLVMSSVSPARQDIQPVFASRVSHVQPSCAIPALRQDRTSDVPLDVHPLRPPMRTWLCPCCREPFRCPQDRKRHLPLHLPLWISCSHDECSWRGYRLDAFRKHWHSEHQSTSQVPDESGSKLYDPWPLVERIAGGTVSIGDAGNLAVVWIKNIALSLDKQELLFDPWGRKGKNLKGSRKYSRFAGRTKAPPITSSAPAFSSAPPTKL